MDIDWVFEELDECMDEVISNPFMTESSVLRFWWKMMVSRDSIAFSNASVEALSRLECSG